jgi:hypothetical protein
VRARERDSSCPRIPGYMVVLDHGGGFSDQNLETFYELPYKYVTLQVFIAKKYNRAS